MYANEDFSSPLLQVAFGAYEFPGKFALFSVECLSKLPSISKFS
jgi:hypothetical protein